MLLVLRSKKETSLKVKKFNRKISNHLKRAGISFYFASFEDIELYMENGKVDMQINGKPLSTWRTIYPRKVGSYRGLAFILANLCKKDGIFFIDHFHEKNKDSSDTAKLIQTFRFAQGRVPIPKTYHSASYLEKHLKNAVEFLAFPIVIKQCNTSQGSGVALARTMKELAKVIDNFRKCENKGEIFLQEFIPNDFEYRILITGNQIGAAEKKIRTKKGEFRNNVFLGAKEEFLDVSRVKRSILEVAKRASRVSDIQVCGVDVIESDGKPIVFEANSCPAFTLDEKMSPELKSLAKYLELCEKR